MPFGDDAQIPQMSGTSGQPTLQSLNENLKRVWEALHSLAGITADSEIRSNLTVRGAVTSEGTINVPSITTTGVSITPADIDADGAITSPILYGLIARDTLGVGRDMLYPGILSPVVRDEFLGRGTSAGNTGDLGWDMVNGTITPIDGESGHPGIITLSTGAAPVVARISLSGVLANEISYMAALVRPGKTSSIASAAIRFGALQNPGSGNTRGHFFSYSSSVNANWLVITRDATGLTSTATSVPVLTSSWYLLEMLSNGSAVDFYINRRSAGRHTTNVEVSSCQPTIVMQTMDAADKALDIDAFAFVAPLGTIKKWT